MWGSLWTPGPPTALGPGKGNPLGMGGLECLQSWHHPCLLVGLRLGILSNGAATGAHVCAPLSHYKSQGGRRIALSRGLQTAT